MGVFKKVGGRLVDTRVDKWMSLDYLNETAERFKILMMDIVVPQKATHSETFEEAMVRLELTEEDLVQRQLEFRRLFYFFFIISFIIVGYGLYLAFTSSLIPALICFGLAIYSLSQAFRFHFWLFQLRERRLGCSIKDWINSRLTNEQSHELAVKSASSGIKPKRDHKKASK
jgi:intracellular multiplication protein IcmV